MKKIYSLLLLGGLLLFGVSNAWGATTYFLNSDSWGNTIKCHRFEATSGNTSWPGEAMTKIGVLDGYGLYSFDSPATDGKVVFTNKNEGSNQTGDLGWTSNKYYKGTSGGWYDFVPAIDYDWSSGELTLRTMTDNGDGTYSYVGTLGTGDVKIITEGGVIATFANASIDKTGFAVGDRCIFIFTPQDGSTPASLTLSATNYYLRGDFVSSWAITDDYLFTSIGNDLYSVTINSMSTGAKQFKIFDNADQGNWDGVVASNTKMDNSRSNINLYSTGENITFSPVVSSNITIVYDKANDKVYVTAATGYRTITVYLRDVDGSSNRSVYAWYGDGNVLNGNFAEDYKKGVVTETINGQTFYKHIIGFPSSVEDKDLKLIFHTVGGKQTSDIYVGAIKRTSTHYFTVKEGDTNLSYTQLNPNSLVGSFNGWNANDVFFDENPIIIMPLESSGSAYLFKVLKNTCGNSSGTWTWFGYGTDQDYKTISATSTETLESGEHADIRLSVSTTGDYVFGWNTAAASLSVTFPGTYSRSLNNAWGTICLPYAVTSANRAASNAKYYSISHIADSKLYLKEETGNLAAGQPYIFEYQGAVPGTLTITCGTAASEISNNRGLIGTYVQGTIASGENYYIVQGGVVKAVDDGAVNIAANRAYIDKDEVDKLTPSLAPTLRELPFAPQSPTDIQSVEANEKAVKFFENGKLLILREGVVYDATGRIVR